MIEEYGNTSVSQSFSSMRNEVTLNTGDYLFTELKAPGSVAVYVTADGTEKKLTKDSTSTKEKYVFDAQSNGIAGKRITGIRFEVSGTNGTTYIYRTGIYRGKDGNALETAGETLSKSEYFYQYRYSATGYMKATKNVYRAADAEPIKEVYYFNALGKNLKTERYNGNTKYTNTYEYDLAGNLLREYTDDSGSIPFTEYTYDYANRPVSVANANTGNNVMYTAYDSAGRTSEVSDFEGNLTQYEYDSLGRQIRSETTADYESGLKSVTLSAYDKLGNLTDTWTSSNEADAAVTYDRVSCEYNWRGQPTKETTYKTDGTTADSYVQYYYDEVGNKVRMYTGQSTPITINGLDNVSGGGTYSTTKYEYDYLNRLVKMTDPLGQSESYTPDYNGLVLEETDRNGNVINNSYDQFGRLLNITAVTEEGREDSHSFEYDMLGAVTKKDNTVYEYDGLGNMIKETNPDTNTVKEYLYDSFGNRTEFKLLINGTVQQHLQYNYNSVKLLDNIKDMLDNGGVIESYQYTPNGLISKKTTTKTNVTVDYAYNGVGQVKNITVKKGNEVIGQYEYSYYANGNMKDKNELVNSGELKTTEYEYDGMGRLVTESSEGISMTYAYDKRGNRSSMAVSGVSQPYTTSYTYDKNNRMTKESKVYSSGGNREETEYYYDPNGNMISKAKGEWKQTPATMSFSMLPTTTKGSGVYEYNGFNQLVSLYESATNSTCEYTYNADGLRTSKTVNGVTTNHIWDGMNIVAETNGSNEVTSVYTRGKTLISAKNGTVVTYYLHNGHGDVNMLMDADGNVTKQYSYDAFGVEQNMVASDTNPFRYCGEYYDKETDNIYLRARYYSPVQGRFITEDPIHDGLNWYGYCGGNPVMFFDPSGLFDYNSQLKCDPNIYSPDVRTLQNELAWRGYLTKDDINGYFGEKTLAAVNSYKNDMGLWNTGDFEGVVGLTTWKSLELIYREQIDIDAGVIVVNVGGKQYFDISKPVNDAVYNAKSEFENHKLDISWFVNEVKNQGEWNVKRDAGVWSKTLGISENSYNTTMLFYGRVVVVDDIGNITFGYLGKAAGFSATILKGGSMGYHVLNHGLSNFDNESSDEAYVQLGIDWYNGIDIQVVISTL